MNGTRWRSRLIGAVVAPVLALTVVSPGHAAPADPATAAATVGVAGEQAWCSIGAVAIPGSGSEGPARTWS